MNILPKSTNTNNRPISLIARKETIAALILGAWLITAFLGKTDYIALGLIPLTVGFILSDLN